MPAQQERHPGAPMAAAVVVASVVGMDPGGWYPFGPAKWHAVLLAVVLAAWTTATGVPAGERVWSTDGPVDAGRLYRRVTRWSWSSLLLLLALAAVFGREPWYAWIGTPERRLGWATWVMFAVCWWIGRRQGVVANQRLIVRATSGAMLFVAGFSLWELAFGSPVAVDTVGERIGGPYGSAAFLGAALCLLLPPTLAVWFDPDEPLIWRVVGAVGTVLGVVTLVGSGARAPVVGLIVAIMVFVAVAVRSRRGIARVLAVGVVIGGVAVLAVTLSGGRFDSSVSRLGRAAESSRLAEWGVGARIVAAHPVLGVGPEGYRTALEDGISAEYERTYGRDVIPDRAHNAVIDVAAAGGVGAGVVFVVLNAAVVGSAVVLLRRGTTLDRGVAAAVIAYIVQQVFLFPVSVIDPLFWLFAGIVGTRSITVVAANARRHDVVPQPSRHDHRWPDHSSRLWVQRVVGAVATAAVLASAVTMLAADRLAAQAVRSDRGDLAERAARLRPDVVRYWLLDDRESPMTVSGITAGLQALEAAARVSPLDPVVRRRHAERLLDRAIATGGLEDRQAAVGAWSTLATDANCYRCHLGYGYALALDGDRLGAVRAFERAAELAPEGDDEARRNVAALNTSRPPDSESSAP